MGGAAIWTLSWRVNRDRLLTAILLGWMFLIVIMLQQWMMLVVLVCFLLVVTFFRHTQPNLEAEVDQRR